MGDSWNADARLEIPRTPEKNIIEIEKARLCFNNLVMALPLRSWYIFGTSYNRVKQVVEYYFQTILSQLCAVNREHTRNRANAKIT